MFYGVLPRMFITYGDCFGTVNWPKGMRSTAGTRRLGRLSVRFSQNCQLCTDIRQCTTGSVQASFRTPRLSGINLSVLYDPATTHGMYHVAGSHVTTTVGHRLATAGLGVTRGVRRVSGRVQRYRGPPRCAPGACYSRGTPTRGYPPRYPPDTQICPIWTMWSILAKLYGTVHCRWLSLCFTHGYGRYYTDWP